MYIVLQLIFIQKIKFRYEKIFKLKNLSLKSFVYVILFLLGKMIPPTCSYIEAASTMIKTWSNNCQIASKNMVKTLSAQYGRVRVFKIWKFYALATRILNMFERSIADSWPRRGGGKVVLNSE